MALRTRSEAVFERYRSFIYDPPTQIPSPYNARHWLLELSQLRIQRSPKTSVHAKRKQVNATREDERRKADKTAHRPV
jgi:hypothetical protein